MSRHIGNELAAGFLLMAVALSTGPAFGQPPAPPGAPPWWGRTDSTTITEVFGFPTAANPPQPDSSVVPPWYPEAGGTQGTINNMQHWPDWDGRSGVWVLSGTGQEGYIRLKLPNEKIANCVKIVWLQWEEKREGTGTSRPSLGAEGGSQSSEPTSSTALGNGWYRHTKKWTINPQPKAESVQIGCGTGSGWGRVIIDNISLTVHCELKDTQYGYLHSYSCSGPGWPPPADYQYTPPWHTGTAWDRLGAPLPEWLPGVGGRIGALGIPGGVPGTGVLMLHSDDLAQPDGVKHVAYQFDVYWSGGEPPHWAPIVAPGSAIVNARESIEVLPGGWLQVLYEFDAVPPPDWQAMSWNLFTSELSGPAAIDNIVSSAGTLWPDRWAEDFGFCELGLGLHGQYGWKGWDNQPAADGIVTFAPAYISNRSLEVAAGTDLVHEFDGFTADTWVFSTYMYIPADFQSSGTPPYRGSFLILLNTYNDGGPYNWSVQLHADSDSQSFIRDGLIPMGLPLITNEWVELRVLIDLNEDLYRVFYGGVELGVAESWTAGVLGEGGGALNIGAVDLFGNGSTPVYYDDFTLRAVYPVGDLNCDRLLNTFDIDPFVLALTSSEPGYWEYYATLVDGNRELADCNGDGLVNAFDIDPFVLCLTSGCAGSAR
jgi:hypothetical protein